MVLKGVLSEVGLPAALAQLADGGSSGCLHVKDPVGEQAQVFLRGGRVYSVVAPGRAAPELGSRLVSRGDLAPEALADAVEAQRTELQGWRLGELLVHLGYVEQPVIEAFVQEQLRAAMADLLRWDEGTWRFRVNERTREDVTTPVAVAELLAEVERRSGSSEAIRAQVPGGSSVPVLASAGSTEDELAIDSDAWSLLCKVDGLRTVTELARDGGFTLYEAAGVFSTLVTAGLVEVLAPTADQPGETVEQDTPDVPGAASSEAVVSNEAAVETRAVPTALLAAFAPSDVPAREDGPADEHGDDDVEDTLHRVSDSLAAMLGPGRPADDLFAAFVKPPLPEPEPDLSEVQLAESPEALRRRDVALRFGDAAELLAETPDAIVVDLAARRALGRPVDQDGVRQDVAVNERLERERLDEQAEAERVDPERAETELVEAADALETPANDWEPVAPVVPQAVYEPEDDSPVWAGQDTDTASLLRELSSLGFDDDEPDDHGARPVTRQPVGAPQSKQKKKGLFGRG